MVELLLTFHFIPVVNSIFELLCIGIPIILVKSLITIWLFPGIFCSSFWPSCSELLYLRITCELVILHMKKSLQVTLTITFINSKNKMRRNIWFFLYIWRISCLYIIPDTYCTQVLIMHGFRILCANLTPH